MMAHSSHTASCGARARNCTRAICRSHFLPAPGSLISSPGGGNGDSPDQYQTSSGPALASLNSSARSRYSLAVSSGSLAARSQRTASTAPNARTASTTAQTSSGTPDVITYGR